MPAFNWADWIYKDILQRWKGHFNHPGKRESTSMDTALVWVRKPEGKSFLHDALVEDTDCPSLIPCVWNNTTPQTQTAFCKKKGFNTRWGFFYAPDSFFPFPGHSLPNGWDSVLYIWWCFVLRSRNLKDSLHEKPLKSCLKKDRGCRNTQFG